MSNHKRLYLALARLSGPGIRALFRLRYENANRVPQTGGLVVCCNHRSVYDPVLLALAFRRQIRYMAESELFTDYGRFFHHLLYALGAFPVRKGHGDVAAIETAERIVAEGGIVGIFPQGDYDPDDGILHPKEGAAKIAADTETPILPAAIVSWGNPRPMRRTAIRFGKLISAAAFPLREDLSVDVGKLTKLIGDGINELFEVQL